MVRNICGQNDKLHMFHDLGKKRVRKVFKDIIVFEA